jgi:DNA-binding response OmpR family regulator
MAGFGLNPRPGAARRSVSQYPSETGSGARRCHIVIVEDNRADVFLIREAIEIARIDAELQIVQDGEKAIQFFDQIDGDASLPCPSLLVLDINLPKRPGNEVLSHMRRSRRCANAHVVVVTSSDSERDREEMRKLDVKAYFRKPSDYMAFMKLGDLIKELLA